MSRAAKQGFLILGILLFVALGVIGVVSSQKQTLENSNRMLKLDIEEYAGREKKYITENKQLQDTIKALNVKKAEIEEKLVRFEGVDLEGLKRKIKSLKEELIEEQDSWRNKVDDLKKERDDLVTKLQEKPKEKIVYKYVEKDSSEETETQPEQDAAGQTAAISEKPKVKAESKSFAQDVATQNDEYWAAVLKEKVAMQLEVEKLKKELTDNAVDVIELKKQNSDMQLELSKLQEEKGEIVREIKYGKDLSDTLSLELARAKNDNKFLNDRIQKITQDNSSLRSQIKQLTSTKIALEKSIVRIEEEKKNIARKLDEAENVIQTRIDEIWDIKGSIDSKLTSTQSSDGQIELPPIIVSPQEQMPIANPSIDKTVGASPGYNGNVVSVNDNNNFVIVDIGEKSGLQLGDELSVYRGAEYVAGLEVIQVRSDIAAADIRNRKTDIKIGDTVR